MTYILLLIGFLIAWTIAGLMWVIHNNRPSDPDPWYIWVLAAPIFLLMMIGKRYDC